MLTRALRAARGRDFNADALPFVWMKNAMQPSALVIGAGGALRSVALERLLSNHAAPTRL